MTADDQARVEEALDDLLGRFPVPAAADRAEFLRARYDAGLAWVHFPPGRGGLGAAAGLQDIVRRRLEMSGAPEAGSGDYVGIHQVAAALNGFGSPTQQERFLPGIFDGTENWCQLFSEPGAGSDLAGLSTLAIRDGDEWVVTGQKVWTSGADRARWAILLARSDPDAVKHRGLTCFVCDMSVAGIEVRPLRQADGAAHFNEVFLDGVRLSDDLRLGDVSAGWGVAVAALHSEREGIGDALRTPWDEVADAWQGFQGRSPTTDALFRQRVVGSWVEAKVLDLLSARLLASQGAEGSSPLGSLLKVAQSGVNQRAASLVVDLMGMAGQIGFDYAAALADDFDRGGPPPQMLQIRSRANSIEGGTDEIQRNIIGERVLGLPGDVRVDKDRAWRDVPRSAGGGAS